MITSKQLADAYAVNLQLIEMQTEGLSQEDTLVRTAYHINSLNWVLGHIAVNRDNVLRALGQEPVLDQEVTDRYKRGSEPVTADQGDILTLEELLDVLKTSQAKINEALSGLPESELGREIVVGSKTVTLASRLFGLYFHDTYHTGQTDLLRQVSGADDTIIP
jgi:uncharacterized damage-inducible protein DinB